MDTRPAPAFQQWVADLLPNARWFAGKGRDGRITDVFCAAEWTPSHHPLESWIIEVTYPDASVEDYHLVVEHTAHGPREPSLAGWQRLWHSLARRIAATEELPVGAKTWPQETVRPVTGEQTHTSFLVGDSVVLKVYRRVERIGEVQRFFPHAPQQAPVPHHYAAFGAADYFPLFTVTQQIPNASDGWRLATQAARSRTSFEVDAAALGRALRLVHQSLLDLTVPTRVAGSGIAEQMAHRLEAAAGQIPALRPLVESCHRVFASLAKQHVSLQAVHGDFHLGQTLREPTGRWWIIDFDGEPLKPVADRWAPDSPWRDVAGMLRSFDYAARAAGADGETWQAACGRAFLGGYVSPAAEVTADESALIAAYEVDKAIYDITYESHHRPSWVPMALSALTAVLERQGER